jgi:nucleotide-binding universal stress UspA family protein
MAAKRQAPRGALRIRHILAPTDFSAGAEPATRWAMALGKAFGAKVTLFHVIDLTLGALAGLPPEVASMPATRELAETVRAEAKEKMARLAARHPRARTVMQEGSPRPLIVEAAKKLRADLIVLGTHGRTGLAHVLFGSVAEYVVQHSPIPVLTVRRRDKI